MSQSLDEGHALDVTNSTAELDDAHIGLLVRAIDRRPSDTLDPVLDGVRNMWNTASADTISMNLACRTMSATQARQGMSRTFEQSFLGSHHGVLFV